MNEDASQAVRLDDGSGGSVGPILASPGPLRRFVPGEIVYSTSCTNHRFVAHFVDMLEVAVRTGDMLRALVIEEVRGRQVAAGDLDSLLNPNGEYLQLQPVEELAAVLSATPGVGTVRLADPRAALLTVDSMDPSDARGRVRCSGVPEPRVGDFGGERVRRAFPVPAMDGGGRTDAKVPDLDPR